MIAQTLSLAPRIALSTFLTLSCFKHVVIKETVKAIKAETCSVGHVTFVFCYSTVVLVLAADASAKKIISTFNANPKDPLSKDPITDYADARKSKPTSPSTPSMDFSNSESTAFFGSPIARAPSTVEDPPLQTPSINRYSYNSESTLVADDDDDDDDANDDWSGYLSETIEELEQEYEALLAMQASLVDGWAEKMERLGFKSRLNMAPEDW